MSTRATILHDLQSELDKAKKGVLLLVKILNRHELNVLIDNSDLVIKHFNTAIKQECESRKNCSIVQADNHHICYIVIDGSKKQAEKLADALYSKIQLYTNEKHPEIYLRCSVGGIQFSEESNIKARRLVSMLQHGIASMCNGACYYDYDEQPLNIEKIRTQNTQLNCMRTSLLKNSVKFMYQPVVDRHSGKIEYYECLLRVQDENKGFISVGPMIKEAEANGLINLIDRAVIDMAVNELKDNPDLKLSVNISNVGVLNKKLLKHISTLLKEFNVAKRLIIEITETSLNVDFATTKNFINVLNDYGCRFALDDFGSGFTSFKQLLNLPIDIIKIDGSYIRDILNNKHSKFFVEALINLANDLGVKTVAEFVENGAIARCLIDIKIDGMQGNFFLPASEKRV